MSAGLDATVEIECRYSCDECGLRDVKVMVPARTAKQDVVRWLEDVAMPRLVADHMLRTFLCRPKQLTHVKIPVAGEVIGGAQLN